MIDYKYADLFLKDNVDKQFTITTDDGTVIITNTELHQEQFELNESICSESTLRFGTCESSSVKFKISNVFTSLKGKWITVSCVLNGNTDEPFVFGRYKVDSDKPTADKRYRDIVAYDAMYDILSADVAEWYNSLTFPMTLKAFRNAFISHFNLEEVEISLPNDEMTVERTIEPTEISGKDVITAICEINACFGHIGRSGKFKYIILKEITKGLYPSNTLYPSNDLFPYDTNATRIGASKYIKATYEDFIVQKIDKVQIRQEENDIGGVSGNGKNGYVIEDNFLVYGKSTEELNAIAANFLNAVGVIVYRPSSVTAIGNPCLEVGDPIKVSTKYQNIETYILSRTLKGIQGLKDTYSAKGSEYTDNKVNSVQRSIIQLKGKTNLLIRTVEEIRSTITNVEAGLRSEFLQTAGEIRAEVNENLQELDTELSASIQINSNAIASEVSRAQNAETELSTRLTQTENGFNALISSIDGRVTNLSASLDSVSSEISGYDSRFNKIEQTIEGVTFEDENGITKISGDTITTGTLKGVSVLFTATNTIFWACGVTDIWGADVGGEWVCDSNAMYSNYNGIRTVELFRSSGNASFRGIITASDFTDWSGTSLNSKIDSINTNLSDLNENREWQDSAIMTFNENLTNANTRIAENESDIAVHEKYIFGMISRLDIIEEQLGIQ